MIPSNCHGEIETEKCRLNFMVDSYNPERHHNFRMVMRQVVEKMHIKEVGEYILLVNDYIDQFNISENGVF